MGIEHVQSITISGFRSIIEPLEVSLTSGVTFLLGPNNSGKSSVLRFLAILLNSGTELRPDDLPTPGSTETRANLTLSGQSMIEFSSGLDFLRGQIQGKEDRKFHLDCAISGPQKNWNFAEDLYDIVPATYFEQSQGYLNDFGRSASRQENVSAFATRFSSFLKLPNTVFVPGQRLIINQGQNLPHYGQVPIPGTNIQMNSVVSDLAMLDRPHGTLQERAMARDKLTQICGFLAYCLEVSSVIINVPVGQDTIYISIDGNEQPISHLGSGIEQLIIIGLGSFQFPDRLVLIDEPELHFHPRTQKRMMRFLHESSKSRFVIATHSAAILDAVSADIVQIAQSGNRCTGRTVKSQVDRYAAVRNLGYSPSDLVLANYVIWVEGPSDRIYLQFWIKKIDPDLIEGTDYSVLFYGGSILARHSFDESETTDLVKALSIAKDFAVYMDSDKGASDTHLKARVKRVSEETEKNRGYLWVSAGREIENYVSQETLDAVDIEGLNNHSQYGRIWSGESFDKVSFAEKVVSAWQDKWPLDLREKVERLVDRIRAAR